MTKREAEARLNFESLVRAESTLDYRAATHSAELLLRHGTTYARIQEAICNGVEWNRYDTNESFQKRQNRHEKWTEKREQQLEKRIKEIVAGLGEGFGVIFQGDPRGSTVKITVPSGKTDDWGKEGICVPTA